MEATEVQDSDAQVLSRLNEVLDDIKEIRELYHAPSLSFSVLHKNQTIFHHSLGARDVETQQPADENTIYHLASISKSFLSALVGIAVSEGKIGWKAPITTYLPDFKPSDDPEVGKARILDCLRHSSGLGDAGHMILGPRDFGLVKEENFIEFLNQCPTRGEDGESKANNWAYSNAGYGVLALCLQKVYGMRYYEILQQKITRPLGLDDTIVSFKELATKSNIAHSTATLEDGTVVPLPCRAIDETNTPMLAVVGVMSSSKDLLRFAQAIMEAEKIENETPDDRPPVYPPGNPLREVSTTRGRAYWSRPCYDSFQNEARYCFAWFRVVMPSSTLITLGLNSPTKEEPLDEEFILGRESPKTEVLLHSGGAQGSTSIMYTFPKTSSAIVVFSNSFAGGDAAEATGLVLIQALLDLKPRVEVLKYGKKATAKAARYYEEAIEEWRKTRDINIEEAPQTEYVGKFTARTLTLTVELERSESGEEQLMLTFGKIPETKRKLELYGKDCYSCFPTTKDEWLKESLRHWQGTTGVFIFQRNDQGEVTSILWKYTTKEEAVVMVKQ